MRGQSHSAKAVLGTEIAVNTLEGEKTVKVPAGSQAGRMLRLRGRGLPGLKGGGRRRSTSKIKNCNSSQTQSKKSNYMSNLPKSKP